MPKPNAKLNIEIATVNLKFLIFFSFPFPKIPRGGRTTNIKLQPSGQRISSVFGWSWHRFTVQHSRMNENTSKLTRRDFIQSSSVALAGTALTPTLLAGAEQPVTQKMVGIQVGAISFVDEGTEK